MLEEVASLRATLVLYEAPGRTAETLHLLHEVLGARRVAVARELTKVHEEIVRGTLGELNATEADPRNAPTVNVFGPEEIASTNDRSYVTASAPVLDRNPA